MILTLELPPEVEAALAEDARRGGTTPERIIADALKRQYVAPAVAPAAAKKPVSAMIALFAQWDAEDATDDPAEIARRNRAWEMTKANLEANRFSLEGRTDFEVLLGDDTEAVAHREAA